MISRRDASLSLTKRKVANDQSDGSGYDPHALSPSEPFHRLAHTSLHHFFH